METCGIHCDCSPFRRILPTLFWQIRFTVEDSSRILSVSPIIMKFIENVIQKHSQVFILIKSQILYISFLCKLKVHIIIFMDHVHACTSLHIITLYIAVFSPRTYNIHVMCNVVYMYIYNIIEKNSYCISQVTTISLYISGAFLRFWISVWCMTKSRTAPCSVQ